MKQHEWNARWRHQNEAEDRLQGLKADASDEDIIRCVADLFITHKSWRRPYQIHLFILDMSADNAVAFDWRYKNVRGITTAHDDRIRDWTGVCLQQGYSVAWSRRKHDGGYCYSLKWIRERLEAEAEAAVEAEAERS